MVNRYAVVLLSALMLLISAGAAADTEVRVRPGMMGVADIGVRDCATFNAMHYNGPAGMELNVLTWVQGYVYARTGANLDAMLAAIPGENGNNGWNFDTLTSVFVNYCREQPDAPVSAAAIELFRVLEAGRTAPGD